MGRSDVGVLGVKQPSWLKTLGVGQPSWQKALGAEQPSWLKASRGAGIAGGGQSPWLKAFRGAAIEEAPWMKAFRGAGLDDAPWMKAFKGAGIAGVDGSPWATVLKAGYGIDASAISRTLMPQLPSVSTIPKSFGRKIQLSDETLLFYEETDQFMQDWETDALWLLFLRVGVGAVRPLAQLSRPDVEAAVLLALEMICSDQTYVPALRAAVAKAPHLTSTQRKHLDHMLEHAQEGEYVHASAPLYPGLEGAYREAAYAEAVAERPKGSNRPPGLVTVVKRMPLPAELKTFIKLAIFSGTGHTIRHGSAEGVERRQVLLGIAALAAWLEKFASDAPALEVLGSRLTETLPRAAEELQPALALLSPE